MANTSAAPDGAAEAPLSLGQAAGLMGQPDEPKNNQGEAPAAEAAEAAPQTESAEEAGTDAAADEAQPIGETEGEGDADAGPPIDPPKSWTKAEKDAFKALPRETQQILVERERARDTDINRRLSDISEKTKVADARAQAAEQVRQQYEAALPTLLGAIQQQMAGEFQDVKTWDDVNRMRETDPIRYLRWDNANKQAEQLGREVQISQARQQQEQASKFEAYRGKETKTFLELAPEFADPKTAPKMQSEVQAMFSDVGVTPDELKGLWNGQYGISIHDHRVQMLIRDAVRYRMAQKGVQTAAKKTVPPPQRPGVATNRGEVQSANLQKLHESLNRTGSRRDALAILGARRGSN